MLEQAIEMAVRQQKRMYEAQRNGITLVEFFLDPMETRTSILINDCLIMADRERKTPV